MGRRVWEYNSLTSIHTGLIAYSVVVYLLEDDRPIVEPPYEMKVPTGLAVHRFLFENINTRLRSKGQFLSVGTVPCAFGSACHMTRSQRRKALSLRLNAS